MGNIDRQSLELRMYCDKLMNYTLYTAAIHRMVPSTTNDVKVNCSCMPEEQILCLRNMKLRSLQADLGKRGKRGGPERRRV